MSERNEPAAEAARPADEHAGDHRGQAKDQRPASEAASPTSSTPGTPSGAAVPAGPEKSAEPAEPAGAEKPAEPADKKPADAAPVAGEGGPSPDKAAPAPDKAAHASTAPSAPTGDASGAGSAGQEGAQDPEAAEEAPAEEVRRYDCSVPELRVAGLADAAAAIRQGRLVVIPTDTVYGIGADAFTPSAVNALLAAKGRGRDMPVPVLVGTVRAANALVDDLGPYGQDLIDAFWPGPLTIVCHAGRSLRWDLGETKGTVAVRMPLHAVALDLLKETGPMAVSSANRSGAPPAATAAEAEEQLGDSVAVYLDGGRSTEATPSTIVDLTTPVPRVLRKGAIPLEKLKSIVGYVATDD